jgi:hypothetical protein
MNFEGGQTSSRRLNRCCGTCGYSAAREVCKTTRRYVPRTTDRAWAWKLDGGRVAVSSPHCERPYEPGER